MHVHLHYIVREDKVRSGNDDLSVSAFSLVDVKKHVNSMSMPAGAMTSCSTNDEDMPSSLMPLDSSTAFMIRQVFLSRP